MKRDLLLLLAAAVAGCAPRHTITGHIDSLTTEELTGLLGGSSAEVEISLN